MGTKTAIVILGNTDLHLGGKSRTEQERLCSQRLSQAGRVWQIPAHNLYRPHQLLYRTGSATRDFG
jgi:hypothetical protein